MVQGKILIFDDDTSFLDILTTVIVDLGLEGKFCKTADNALEEVSTFKPDLIIMDHWIPLSGGKNAIKSIKDKGFINIPVIYISANPNVKELSQIASADDYMEKPFDLDEFESKILSYLK